MTTTLATQGTTAVARPRTFLNFVIDESISMEATRDKTISAINEFLQSQRRARIDELFVSTTLFSDAGRVRTLYRNMPIDKVPDLDRKTYRPGGCTALYDGIHAGMRGAEDDTGPGDRILMVIVTDGEENASREIKHADTLRQMVRQREALGNWTFVFLATEIDAFAASGKVGVKPGNTADYADISVAIQKVDSAVKSYRTSDDLKTDAFYHQPKKWQKPQWSKGSGVVITDTPEG